MEELSEYHECDFCRTLVIDLTRKRLSSGEEAPGHIFFLDPKLDSFISAASTCRFSRRLVDNWSAESSCHWEDLKSRGDTISVCMDYLSYSFDLFPLVEIAWIGLWDPTQQQSGADGRCRVKSGGWLDVVTEADNPAAKFVSTRPINQEIGSQKNLDLARCWIAECLETHERCPKLSQTFMPKIVLKINQIGVNQYRAALHYPSAPEPYTALSYCWGGDQPQKTTKRRISSGDLVLDWEVLPASIQDAVRVTAGLGYSYLWVDSLCIVQDDDSDKAKQIAQMPQIYTSAVVTIVASRAERAVDGFLHNIDLDSATEFAVKLPFRCPGSAADGSIFVAKMRNAQDSEPIDYRGWTLQERYLSPRVLEYTSNQLLWTCASSGEKNGYSDGWTTGTRRDESGLFPVGNFHGDIWTGRGTNGLADGVLTWQGLLQIYTRRTLTFPLDRILAISGVAEMFAPILRDQYSAGHWVGSLPYDLLWNAVPGSRLRPRPIKYQAPSWSWAAVNSEISFNYACGANPSKNTPPKAVISDLEIHTELQEPTARFGAVISGYIRGHGRIRKAVWFGNQETSDHYQVLHEVGRDRVIRPIPRLRLIPDALEHEFSGNISESDISIEVYLLLVGSCTGGGLRGLVGIVLRELPGTSGESWRRFTRLGIFHINSSTVRRKALGDPRGFDSLAVGNCQDYFDSCNPENFEII